MESYTISRLALEAGVGVETVRFYQRRNLLDVPEAAGAVRRYDASHIVRLRFIARAKRAGFTLTEISQLIELERSGDRARIRAIAASRIQSLDDEIADKKAARTRLAALEKECLAGGKGACPIVASFF